MDSGDWWATVQSFAELDMTEVIEHTRTNFRIQALGHLETRPLSGRRQMAVIWFAFQKLVEDAVQIGKKRQMPGPLHLPRKKQHVWAWVVGEKMFIKRNIWVQRNSGLSQGLLA